jgi:hypothetical protein
VTRVNALDVDAAKNIAVAVMAGSVILAILTAMFVRAALTKAVVILLLGGLVVVMVGQRSNITKCAERIEAEYRAGNGNDAACTFLGREFSVDVPEQVGTDTVGDVANAVQDAVTEGTDAVTSTSATDASGSATPELVDMSEG